MSRPSKITQPQAARERHQTHSSSTETDLSIPTRDVSSLSNNSWLSSSSQGTTADLAQGVGQVQSNQSTFGGVIDNVLHGNYNHGSQILKIAVVVAAFGYFVVRDNELGLFAVPWSWNAFAWSIVKGLVAAVVVFAITSACEQLSRRQ